MPHRFMVVCAGLLLLAGISSGQADQAASAEKQQQQQAGEQQKNAPKKQSSADAIAALIGGPKLDKEAVERGRKIFVPTCGFCHGNDAHGKTGPDLVRSPLVLHDNKGDAIGPVIRNGRAERGMPAFASFTNEQIEDISTFLHSLAQAVTNRFAYQIGDIDTGDATKGRSVFQRRWTLQRTAISPREIWRMSRRNTTRSNCSGACCIRRRMCWMYFSADRRAPVAPSKVTVKLASGEQVSRDARFISMSSR